MGGQGDEDALEDAARAATNLLEHLRGCDDCLREVVRHLYSDQRVLGKPIGLCPVGAPLLSAVQQAYGEIA